MRYVGLKIEKPSSITQKIVNKKTNKPQGMISNVCINVIKISIAVDFHMVLEENRLYSLFLGRS